MLDGVYKWVVGRYWYESLEESGWYTINTFDTYEEANEFQSELIKIYQEEYGRYPDDIEEFPQVRPMNEFGYFLDNESIDEEP